jgi:hypothetical protein
LRKSRQISSILRSRLLDSIPDRGSPFRASCVSEERLRGQAKKCADMGKTGAVKLGASGIIAGVQRHVIKALSSRRHSIHRRWEELLLLERADTPLANPAALVHLIEWTLDRIFEALRSRKAYLVGAPSRRVSALRAHCACGHNPFIKHFVACEQALLEALVLIQAEDPPPDPARRDTSVAELYLVIHEIARREVDSLCSVCRNRVRRKEMAGLPAEQNAV